MSKRLSRVRRDNPELADQEQVKATAADIDTYAALSGFASSEAGTILIKALNADIASAVREIASGYKSLPEIELRAIAAKIDARLGFLQSLNRAAQSLEYAEAYLTELTT